MKRLRLQRTARICFGMLLYLSAGSGQAALISMDWKSVGDNLVTRDTNSGLDWLDLTETNNLSRDFVLTQLVPGGLFEGFRYATSSEVVALWQNLGVDVSAGATGLISGEDPGVLSGANLFGNIWCEFNCTDIPYGVTGITSDQHPSLSYAYNSIGAYYYGTDDYTDYYREGSTYYTTSGAAVYMGHYLVTTAVPVPATIWLFGSGLLGLIGVSRHKKPS